MFTKILDLDLEKYNLSVYQLSSNDTISSSNVIYISGYLNIQNYPSEIVDILGSISGIEKIEVFDKNNTLLLVSSNVFDN